MNFTESTGILFDSVKLEDKKKNLYNHISGHILYYRGSEDESQQEVGFILIRV